MTQMERERNKHASLPVTVLVAALLSQNLLIPVISASVGDQKTYYSPDPHAGTPPGGPHRTPSHGSPKHGGTTPSHGSYNPTPSHGSYNPTPSTGGGGSYGTPSTPTGGGGGGGSYGTPSTPTGGGGGGYYHSPPTSGGGGSPPLVLSPPPTPIPIDPGTPGISTPTPPFLPDPNSPFTGTCNYWITHPTLIWGLLGWWGTLGAFGVPSVPGFGTNTSLQQALTNTRTDGLGELYREGTASLLNSMVNKRFPFTTKQVRERFTAALSSNKAAAAQAHLFKLANEGKLKPRA